MASGWSGFDALPLSLPIPPTAVLPSVPPTEPARAADVAQGDEMTDGRQKLIDAERNHFRSEIERLEAIIKWLAEHPRNDIVGECVDEGCVWGCESYPDEDGYWSEVNAPTYMEAIEKAMKAGATE